jgi:ketosteroid isomerase-like protein
MSEDTNRQIVERFWQTMNSNDWNAVAALLHDDHVLEWPQSGERVRGRANFVAVNAHYPISGPWRFEIRNLVTDVGGAASDVLVTAPSVSTHVVTFFEMRDGRIWRMVEYWPDPFEVAVWRANWVERYDPKTR